ncbi:poly(ADP-ribose) glycohydrolase [Purpureocillium lavendulum]|uniref:poly(ADP-ribose) glycohydrolase n=1 Tax=Purpureocillium lavendulum TaxID=1247861 RepID=A0AB34G5A6_9HYPO|nr:poly(ADP-ribose) glycohydrolase [Purpureocillium lavendulum]
MEAWRLVPRQHQGHGSAASTADLALENAQLITRPRSTDNSPVSSPWVLVDPLFQDLDPSHRYYLSYFTQRLCKDLVSQDHPDRNPFRSLLPLTRAHPLLQHIIVAASAAHMSNLVRAAHAYSADSSQLVIAAEAEEASGRAYRDALIAKHKALTLMRDAVRDVDSTGGDVILAAALFFINVELIESGKHGWKAHLEGAGRIMSLLQPALPGNEALRDYMLSDCFVYFILGSAFMPAAAFDTGSFFQPSQIPSILGRAAANSYLCCPPEILAILHAASQLSNASTDAHSTDEISSAGLALIQRAQAFDINGWANDVRNISYLQDAPVQSRIHAGSAHRLAACLYILQAIPSLSEMKGHEEVAEALSRDIFEHLSKRCIDRFSILEDEQEDVAGQVLLWPLLVELLKQPVEDPSQLIEVLDTIANTMRFSSGAAGDYGMLRTAVQSKQHDFFGTVWPKIVRLALMTPELYPEASLPILTPGQTLKLSRSQAACLVSHQFLCTLRPPPWRHDYFDFSIWYDSSQRHPKAVEMYLGALFRFFEQLDWRDDVLVTDGVQYSLHVSDRLYQPMPQAWQDVALSTAEVVRVQAYSTEQQELGYQGTNGAVVVSANKDIGFGQSATQEELYVGNCPEAYPAVLVTPTLGHDQALVIEGARPMLRIRGQRRDISFSALEPSTNAGGRMLFIDALEIDEVDDQQGLPDLVPSNIDREINKAYTAFSSWPSGVDATVWAGIWGCGAFNGDPGIKMTLLWMAASLAGKELRILCDPANEAFAMQFEAFIAQVIAAEPRRVGDLMSPRSSHTQLRGKGRALGKPLTGFGDIV